jgi:hypothetical protein
MISSPHLIIADEAYLVLASEPGELAGQLVLTLERAPNLKNRETVLMLCHGPNREPVRLRSKPEGLRLLVSTIY